VVAAAERAAAEEIARPALVGTQEEVAAAAVEAGVALSVPVLDPARDPELGALADHLGARMASRRSRGPELGRPEIEALARERLQYAALLVATGRAAGAVMGAVATTPQVLRASLRAVGPRPGLRVVSSCFLMALPPRSGESAGRALVYSDCGVVPDPDPAQLADIAEAAAGRSLPLVIEVDGRLAGQVSFGSIVLGSFRSCFVGYWVSRSMAGQGVVPTAVALAGDHLMGPLGLHRLEVNIRPENTASLAVVRKLGFRSEGLRPHFLHIDGAWRHHRSFALTTEDLAGETLMARLTQTSHESLPRHTGGGPAPGA